MYASENEMAVPHKRGLHIVPRNLEFIKCEMTNRLKQILVKVHILLFNTFTKFIYFKKTDKHMISY